MKNSPSIPELDGAAILSLDLGRRTGWRLQKRSGEQSSGVHELYDPDEKRMTFQDGERFEALRKFIHQMNELAGGLDVIAFEEVNPATHRGNRQKVLYAGFRAVLMAWAARQGIPVIPIPIGTWKKLFTGKGNATKREVIDKCVSLGFFPFDDPSQEGTQHDDNEADAFGIFEALLRLGELARPGNGKSALTDGQICPNKISGENEPETQDVCRPSLSSGARRSGRGRKDDPRKAA